MILHPVEKPGLVQDQRTSGNREKGGVGGDDIDCLDTHTQMQM